VLTLLILHPDEELYQRAIAIRTGSGLLQAQRALRRVEAAGLVTRTNRGNRAYYRVRREHPAFEDLKRLLLRTVALGDALREALAPLRGRLRIAFVYGSVARGAETPTSDIDLFAVGETSLRTASRVLGPAGRRLDREFNPVIYTPQELRARARARDPFVEEVIAGPKIWLIGSKDELARLVE
jgi:predicted nucleotidyltransferase